jgi:hypothetical protein
MCIVICRRVLFASRGEIFGHWDAEWSHTWSEIKEPPKHVAKGLEIVLKVCGGLEIVLKVCVGLEIVMKVCGGLEIVMKVCGALEEYKEIFTDIHLKSMGDNYMQPIVRVLFWKRV